MTFATTFGDLPACAFVEYAFRVDDATLAHLQGRYPLPDHLQRAVLKRQVEFLAGRVCAQQALLALGGQQPASIPSQSDRSPAWPSGVVGSITHTHGYAAALVASMADYDGIGIDCEVVLAEEKLKLQRHLCVTDELENLQVAHPEQPPAWLLSIVFSAKESLFKCLYPRVGTYFGFTAARLVEIDPAQCAFVIRLEQDLTSTLLAGAQWRGQVARHEHLLMTVILAPHET